VSTEKLIDGRAVYRTLGPFGMSIDDIKKVYDKDNSVGVFLSFDSRVHVGIVFYLWNKVLGLWWLK
jgi:hypothetical protein